MSSVSTDPDIQEVILHHLKGWRCGNTASMDYAPDLKDLIYEQNLIGWQKFFEGWISSGWEEAQHAYYSLLHSHRTGHRWTICLIKKLFEYRMGNVGTPQRYTTPTRQHYDCRRTCKS